MEPIRIKNDERVMFIGKTGYGKTVLAKHFLAKMNRVLVIDPKHTFKLEGFRRGKGLPAFGKDFHIIYRPRIGDDEHLADLVYRLNKMRDVTIYCDELSSTADMFPATTAMLADVARTGRERRVALWNAVQRPRWTPRVFFTEAEVYFLFNLRSGEDRAYMSQFVGPEAIDQIDKFNFWYERPEMRAPALLRLDLARGGIIPLVQGGVPATI